MQNSFSRLTFCLLCLLLALAVGGLLAEVPFLSEWVMLFAFVFAAFFLTPKKNFRPSLHGMAYLFPLFFLLPLLTCCASFFLSWLYGQLGLSAPTAADEPLWLLMLCSGLLPALKEELFFRGGMLHGDGQGVKGGEILLSAICFSLLHANFYQIPYAFLSGLLLGGAAVCSGGWFLPFLLHLTNNLLSLVGEKTGTSGLLLPVLLLLFLLSLLPFLFSNYRRRARQFFDPFFAVLSDRAGRKQMLGHAIASPLWIFAAAAIILALLRLF